MKRFFLNACLAIAALTAVSGAASAQGLGTYCSAKTLDGAWAVRFGPAAVQANCDAVLSDLRSVTGAEVTGSRYGYYNLNGVNRVLTRCGFYYRNITSSIGGYALQNAVDTARFSGLTHCLFVVNGY
jgi:hypothetical protein